MPDDTGKVGPERNRAFLTEEEIGYGKGVTALPAGEASGSGGSGGCVRKCLRRKADRQAGQARAPLLDEADRTAAEALAARGERNVRNLDGDAV
jgi:hypothetical protein